MDTEGLHLHVLPFDTRNTASGRDQYVTVGKYRLLHMQAPNQPLACALRISCLLEWSTSQSGAREPSRIVSHLFILSFFAP